MGFRKEISGQKGLKGQRRKSNGYKMTLMRVKNPQGKRRMLRHEKQMITEGETRLMKGNYDRRKLTGAG